MPSSFDFPFFDGDAGGNLSVASGAAGHLPFTVPLWTTSFFRKHHFFWSPVIYAGQLFMGGVNAIACMNLRDGSVAWKVELEQVSYPMGAVDGDYVAFGRYVLRRSDGHLLLDLAQFFGPHERLSAGNGSLRNGMLFREISIAYAGDRQDEAWHLLVDIEKGTSEIRPATGIALRYDWHSGCAIGRFSEVPGHWVKKDILTGTVKWSHPIPLLGSGKHGGLDNPVLVGDELYLRSGIDGFLVLDRDSGLEKMRVEGYVLRDPSPPKFPGREAMNLIVTQETVILGLLRYDGDSHHTIVAYERRTGRLQWRTSVGEVIPGQLCVHGELLYGLAPSRDARYLDGVAWNVADGAEVWRSAAPIKDDMHVLAGSDYVIYTDSYSGILCYSHLEPVPSKPRKVKKKRADHVGD